MAIQSEGSPAGTSEMPTPDSANAMALGTALDPRHDFPELREAAAQIVLRTAEVSHPIASGAKTLGVGRSTFFQLLASARAYSAARTIVKKKNKRA